MRNVVKQILALNNEYKPLFHSFTPGIMIGYHRAGEIHTEVHDSVVSIGRTQRKVFFYDSESYDENIFPQCKLKIEVNKDLGFGERRKNILNFLPDAIDPQKYKRNMRSQLRRAYKVADKLETKDITSKDLPLLKHIHDEWAKYKWGAQGFHPRTYPSYFLATKRCMDANLKLYNKLFFYDNQPVGFITYDISRDDLASLVSNIHLWFKPELNLPNQYADAVIVYAYKDLYEMGYEVVNTGGDQYPGLERFKTKYIGKVIKHTRVSRDPIEQLEVRTLHNLF